MRRLTASPPAASIDALQSALVEVTSCLRQKLSIARAKTAAWMWSSKSGAAAGHEGRQERDEQKHCRYSP